MTMIPAINSARLNPLPIRHHTVEPISISDTLPPIAKKIGDIHYEHGYSRIDNYHWMRDKNDPDLIPYLENWNSYSQNYLDTFLPFIKQLYQEMTNRIEGDYETIPYAIGNFYYFKRYQSGKDFPIYCRKPSEGGIVEILFDSNVLSAEHAYFDLKELIPSPDGKYMVATIDTDGSHFGQGYIFDCTSKSFMKNELIPHTNGNFVWNAEGTGFWYVKLSTVKRFSRIYFHEVGTSPERDLLVHYEPDGAFDLTLNKDKLNQFLLVTSQSKDTSQIMRMSLNGSSLLTEYLPKTEGVLYSAIQGGDLLYVLTNQPNKNNSLFVVKNKELKPLIISQKDTHIDRIEIFENYIVLKKRIDGLVQFEVLDLKTLELHTIPLPHEICDIDFYYNTSYHTNTVLFTLSSPIIPPSVYEWDMKDRQLILRWQEKAGGFQSSDYSCRRLFAYNGETRIPISLFYKKGLPQDGSRPMRLYCYGAYGMTNDPYFSSVCASFLERGCFYAIAHIRGGGDLGQIWYEEGRLEKKMNSFTDFIACAETLINNGFTSPDKLAIEGGSAGGLVIGAVMNMRPDLFKVCLLDVPFVDVLTTMSDVQIPLTEQEWKEWGNPTIKEHYEWMKLYSPYDNIRAKEYPACLVTGGYNDAQVPIQEPAKFVAKLNEFKVGNQPLLFRTNMNAGHNGKAGRYETYQECAPSYAFLMHQVGIT